MNLIKISHLVPLCFLLLNGVGKAPLLPVRGGGALFLLLCDSGSDVLSFVCLVAPMSYGVAWLLAILTRNPSPPRQWRIVKGCGLGDRSRRAPPLGGAGILTTAGNKDGGTPAKTQHRRCVSRKRGDGTKTILVLLFFFLCFVQHLLLLICVLLFLNKKGNRRR